MTPENALGAGDVADGVEDFHPDEALNLQHVVGGLAQPVGVSHHGETTASVDPVDGFLRSPGIVRALEAADAGGQDVIALAGVGVGAVHLDAGDL